VTAQKTDERHVVYFDEVLRKEAYDRAFARYIDYTIVRFFDASDDAQQRRLTGTVVADETDAAFGRDEPVDAIQDDLFTKTYL
jgi:hypothetical protein